LLTKKEEQQIYTRTAQDAYIAQIHRYELDCERLNVEIINSIAKINELTAQNHEIQKKLVQAQQEHAQAHTASLVAPADDLQIQERVFEKRKQYYHQWVARATLIKQTLQEFNRKSALIADQQNPSCPLCEQNLSAARKRFLVAGFSEQEALLAGRLERLMRIVPQLKQALTEQHAHMLSLKNMQEKQTTARTKAAELHNTVEMHIQAIALMSEQINQHNATIVKLEATLQEKQNALTQLQQQQHSSLANDPLYQTMTGNIVALEHILSTTHYNAEQHARDREQLAVIDALLLKHARAPQEQAEQAQRRVHIKDAAVTLKQIKLKQQELNNTALVLKGHLTQEPLVARKEQELQQAFATLKQDKERVLQEKGGLEHQVARLAMLEQEHKTLVKTTHELGQQAYE
jgi:hypothetical protein